MPRQYQIFGEAMVRVKFGSQVPTLIIGFQVDAQGKLILDGSGQPIPIFAPSTLSDLGLAQGPVTINLNLKHQDVNIDNYGPQVPVDVLWTLEDANIEMDLVHWDSSLLELCLRESAAGGAFPTSNPPVIVNGQLFQDAPQPAGYLAPAGLPLGGGVRQSFVTPLPGSLASGYHFMSLSIVSTLPGALPWRFPASYLMDQPVVLPLGTKRSVAKLKWRAIPYAASAYDTINISGGVTGGSTVNTPGGTSFPVGFTMSTPGEISSSGAFLYDHLLDE